MATNGKGPDIISGRKRSFAEQLRCFAASPRCVFNTALLTGVFCTVCTVLFLTDAFRDTIHVYAVFAREIGRGNFYDGIATQVPMLNILLGGALSYCGMEAVKALSLVAGVFYICTVFPLRRLLERYVSPLMAAYGCLLFITAPKLIRFACAPLLDASWVFLLTGAMLYFLRASEDPTVKNSCLFGLFAGLLPASRGEGLITATALLIGLLLFNVLFRRQIKFRKILAAAAMAAVVAVAVVTPFCAMNYSKSGYFISDVRLAKFVESHLKSQDEAAKQSEAVPAYVLEDRKNNQYQMTFGHMISCAVRAGYELYWILAAIGAVVLYKRKELKSDHLLLVGVTAMQCCLYLMSVSATRYYMFLVPFYMVFTVTGADYMRRKICCYIPARLHIYCGILCAVVLAAQTADGLKRVFSDKGKDYQAAGRWIREYGKKHFPDRRLVVFAPKMTETAYWSGAVHTDGYEKTRHDPATFKEFDLAIVHRKCPLGLDKRKDLERIAGTPHSKDIWIYRVKKEECKK